MNRGIFKWNTTSTTDSRMLYLSVMRDMRSYCARGYCDIAICLSRFLVMPNSLMKRMLKSLPSIYRKDHFIVDWSDLGSVRSFFDNFFIILTHLTHVEIIREDYQKAFDEFTQNITKKSSYATRTNS